MLLRTSPAPDLDELLCCAVHSTEFAFDTHQRTPLLERLTPELRGRLERAAAQGQS